MARRIHLAPPSVNVKRKGEVTYLSSSLPLEPHPLRLGDLFRRAAAMHPERTFLMEPAAGGYRSLTYFQALRAAEGVAAWLVEAGHADRPAMVLSGNSIDHALLMLGCMLAGVPIAPVSPAYSLMSTDFEKVRSVAELLEPGIVFVEVEEPYAGALDAMGPAEVVTGALLRARFEERSDALAAREAAVTGDTVAKILFTSGSTGRPKGVLNTHRMLTANQQMIAQLWPFLEEIPPVLVDWLPWSHTFGGNHNFNMVLQHAGTLLVDDGKPTEVLVDRTIRNLKSLSPTIYFNVPAGYAALLPRLEEDAELRERFFASLRVLFYAGAALPQDLWERLERLTDRPVFMTTAWGSTETSPMSTSAHFEIERAGNIGLPAPGVELKLVPNKEKLEVRVRGPHVTPGYHRAPALTEEAFDEERFYRIGDAVKLADPDDPARGLIFDGRVAEDFKLTTGTWVSVGRLRTALIACASPAVQDVVVAGHDREAIGILVWPTPEWQRREGLNERLRTTFLRWNEKHPGRSTRVERLLLMTEPPSIDAGEITDKGYVNQRRTLERRRVLVERLFEDPAPDDVIDLARR